MRNIDIKIIYADRNALYAYMCEATPDVANIYVNADDLRQIEVHSGNEQEDIERFYREQYPSADPTIFSIRKNYREESEDSPIYYGSVITEIHRKDQEVYYEFNYAGRRINHRGIIPRADWQNFLFEKWQEEYGNTNQTK